MDLLRARRGDLLAAALFASALGASFTAPVNAEESQFGFVYTTDLLPKGAMEVEQWSTWRFQKVAGQFDQIDGRTEFEYGLTDNLQLAMYANYTWAQAYRNGPYGVTTPPEPLSYDAPDPYRHYQASRLTGFSGEMIYRILSPYTDKVGLAVYVEPTIGAAFRELETKLILQKNFLDDRLTTAFNFTYAPEWRNQYEDGMPGKKAWNYEVDVNAGFAAAYRFRPNWSLGFELENEHEYNSYKFSRETNNGYFIGPSIHYGGKRFFVTATFLEQLPWATTHSDTVPGAVVGRRDYDNDFERYRLRVKAGFYF
ncbi:DUF6662 family protein [Dyella flagellata]|uniref:Lipoprotein n=1 Tax=Dyella flagellata TaxID=1867833 RepID=A0ABQ5X7U5_9GAMM|nr:DUF6662 family protein [Dyella flagellata]GLQ87648.1 hypothetical protein GCM10007898_12140 [Dyella flagellata]